MLNKSTEMKYIIFLFIFVQQMYCFHVFCQKTSQFNEIGNYEFYSPKQDYTYTLSLMENKIYHFTIMANHILDSTSLFCVFSIGKWESDKHLIRLIDSINSVVIELFRKDYQHLIIRKGYTFLNEIALDRVNFCTPNVINNFVIEQFIKEKPDSQLVTSRRLYNLSTERKFTNVYGFCLELKTDGRFVYSLKEIELLSGQWEKENNTIYIRSVNPVGVFKIALIDDDVFRNINLPGFLSGDFKLVK